MPRRRRSSALMDASRGRVYLAALVAIVLIAGSAVYAFGKQSLFAGGYEVKAMFRDASQLRGGNPVRVGGLDIGRIVSVKPSPEGVALVTMRLKSDAPTLRTTDTMTIKPRLPFEGNFYVDVTENDPLSPPLRKGDTVPTKRTSSSVQIDQVLSTFDRNARRDGKSFIHEFASGLGTGGASGPVGNATGVQGLRRSVAALNRALVPTTRTAKALRGQNAGDLTRSLRSTSEFTSTLARNPDALSDIVSNYSTVVGRLAASDADIRSTLRSAGSLLRGAPSSLTAIDAALPITRRFAVDLRPTLRALPKRLPAINRTLVQLRRVSRPGALPAFSRRLQDPVTILPQVVGQLRDVLPGVASLGRCVSRVVVPTAEQVIPDGIHTVPQPAWLELLHAFSGLAAASPTFDANGSTIRAGLNEGDNSLQGSQPGITDSLNVINGAQVQGVSPEWLGTQQKPLKRVDLPCEDQKIADFSQLTNAKPFLGFKKVANSRKGLSDGEVSGLETLRSSLGKRLRNAPAGSPARVAARRDAAASGGSGGIGTDDGASITGSIARAVRTAAPDGKGR